MKKKNGLTVYEEDDISALDEYSEQLAEDIKEKFKEEKYDDSEIKEDISTIQTEQTTQNERIIELEAETERLRSDLNLSTATVKGSGESVTLKGTSGARFKKLGISGNSWQESRSGKNLLGLTNGIYTNKGVTVIVSNGIITLSGTSNDTSIIDIPLIEPIDSSVGTVIKSLNPNGTYTGVQTSLRASNSDTSVGLWSSDATDKSGTLSGNAYYLRIQISYNITVDCTLKAQVEEGTEVTDYEQYGVQPSPDYPSTIRNCGENVNEFDGELEIGLIDWNTGENGKNNNRMRSKNYVQIDKNETYTFSWDNTNLSRITIYEYKDNYEYYKTNAIYIYNGDTYKPTTTDAKYIRFFTSDNFNDTTTKIKIEKGTKSTPYSPYNCGNANIEVSNKNLFDGKYKLGGINGNTGAITTGSSLLNKDFIKVKELTAYTISTPDTVSFSQFYIYEYDKNFNYNLTSNKSVNKGSSFTTNANTKYIMFRPSSSSFSDTSLKVQIEKGSTATSYVPHQSQLITFPFTEGQRLYKGSYLAEDGIHHVRKQIVLDGTEDIKQYGNYIYLYLEDCKLSLEDNTQVPTLMSNAFKTTSVALLSVNPDISITNNTIGSADRHKGIMFWSNNYFNSVETAKAYLAQQYANGTPVIIEYELAEEIIEPYTTEQQEVWDYIEKIAHSYEGKTYITCPDETSLNFEAEAVMSMNTIVDAILSLGGNI